MNDTHPYKPPTSSFLLASPTKPGVWRWYVAYCIAMGLLYAGTLIVGVVFISMAEVIASEDPDMSAHEAQIFGGLFALISLPLCVFYLAAPLLPKTRFAWIYGIVAIAIGMTSACCLPAAIPLLIFWIKSDTKAFFQIA